MHTRGIMSPAFQEMKRRLYVQAQSRPTGLELPAIPGLRSIFAWAESTAQARIASAKYFTLNPAKFPCIA